MLDRVGVNICIFYCANSLASEKLPPVYHAAWYIPIRWPDFIILTFREWKTQWNHSLPLNVQPVHNQLVSHDLPCHWLYSQLLSPSGVPSLSAASSGSSRLTWRWRLSHPHRAVSETRSTFPVITRDAQSLDHQQREAFCQVPSLVVWQKNHEVVKAVKRKNL